MLFPSGEQAVRRTATAANRSSSSTRARRSRTRRDLPMPASPIRRTTGPSPATARFKRSSRRPSSSVAADQRGAEAKGLEPASLSRGVERAEQAVHRVPPLLPLQRKRRPWARTRRHGGRGDTSSGRPAPRRYRQGLQALRGVHRIAGNRVGLRSPRAEATRDHRARVDADDEARAAGRCGRASVHQGAPSFRACASGCSERALGVVLMGVSARRTAPACASPRNLSTKPPNCCAAAVSSSNSSF